MSVILFYFVSCESFYLQNLHMIIYTTFVYVCNKFYFPRYNIKYAILNDTKIFYIKLNEIQIE